MKATDKSIFDEQYRVVSIESDRLVVQGILSGEILTILNPQLESPLNQKDFLPGKLIELSDPSTQQVN
jgi:hypothetical protein